MCQFSCPLSRLLHSTLHRVHGMKAIRRRLIVPGLLLAFCMGKVEQLHPDLIGNCTLWDVLCMRHSIVRSRKSI